MDCCDHCQTSDPERGNPSYRRALWIVLAINAGMFLVEIGAGLAAGSASLQADALDFLGDAAKGTSPRRLCRADRGHRSACTS